jgi:aspartyl protease family protein
MCCVPCTQRQRANKRIAVTTAAIGTLVAAVVAAFFIRGRQQHVAAERNIQQVHAAEFDYGAAEPAVRQLSRKLGREPCDRRSAVELATVMLQAGDGRGVTQRGEAFLTHCGELPELRRLMYEAYEQLSEPAQAVVQATKLLERDPYNSTFFAHRALAYEQQGTLDRAEHDYAQALLFRPRLADIPINLANLYERQGRPCEAVFSLERVIFYYPDAGNIDSIRARVDSLLAKPECSGLTADGKATLRRVRGEALLRARVRLQGRETGSFVVDTGASYVAITAAFAHRLALDLSNAPHMLFQTAGGVREGAVLMLDRVELQGAKASRVLAVVVDDLGDLDGLLGLSFLSRFELHQSGDTIEITPRGRPHQTASAR